MASRSETVRRVLTACAATTVLASLLLSALSWVLPRLIARDYDARSLASLRERAERIRSGSRGIIARLDERMRRFDAPSLPEDGSQAFPVFQRSGLDPEREGIALFGPDNILVSWFGDVLPLADILDPEALEGLARSRAAFLVRHKATVHLIKLQRLAEGEGGRTLAHFLRLAFIPQFQSSYIQESHLLERVSGGDLDIEYWDVRDDVEGFEAFFTRHDDEYRGQPRQAHDIQTIFFPLRSDSGRILATVTLASPSLASKLSTVREDVRLAVILILSVAGLMALALLASFSGARSRQSPWAAALGGLLVIALRVALLPLGDMSRLATLRLFQPSVAGFSSWLGLTRSPADILLTALAALGLSLFLNALWTGKADEERGEGGRGTLLRVIVGTLLASAVAASGTFAIRTLIVRIVLNSNLSMLRWDLDPSRLSLQLSLLVFLAAALLAESVAFRFTVPRARGRLFVMGTAALASAVGALAAAEGSVGPMISAGLLTSWLVFVSTAQGLGRRRELAFGGLLLASLWVSTDLEALTMRRTRSLIETTVARTIETQEIWGNFLIEESVPGLDRSERLITAYLRDPRNPDFAQTLWERTPLAKTHWYSSLEVRDAEGNTLSRFSLNVPKVLGRPPELEPSDVWTIVPHVQMFIGKEKDFLIGYRDYEEDGVRLGRIILYVALDPEMLPFLYSANPYFEALRTDTLPSLSEFDLGCEIFDLDGRSLFNPRKLTTGLTAGELEELRTPDASFWSEFREAGVSYDAHILRSGERAYRLFTPRKDLPARVFDLLMVLFLGLAAVAAVLLAASAAAGRIVPRNPLWSFSNRVYAAFLAVALVPLLLYSVFTRDLFGRLFAERFVEDSAVHASYAQGLLEAFLIIQGMEVSPYLAPSEDLALWISSTLANDVILYGDAVLLASSRREFFDSGLLPELLDGEATYELTVGRKPFHTRRTRIGGYAFQTLTVAYDFKDTTLFISVPFPYEREQLTKATREIAEFLVLLGSFFVALVIVFSRGIKSMIIVPIRKLVAGTREVGSGNLEVTIEHRSKDEMMMLINGFNTMIRNLKDHERELAEMSKKVAWTEMARKVAHEIKNPLTPIQLSAEHVLKVYEEGRGDLGRAIRESMSYIISEVENLRRIAREFMEIARDTTVRRDAVDLQAVLEEALDPYRRLLSERIRFVVSTAGAGLWTRGDAAKLKTALRNVIANAVEAIGREGDIEVRMERRGPAISIAVRDTGAGMAAETLEHVFDLYYSTKEGGTGLGLPITKKIVEEHGGTIRLDSRPGQGTTVTIELPAEE